MTRMKTLIAIPCMSKVDTEFMMCMLRMKRPPDTDLTFNIASLVYDSRNAFAARAIADGYDRLCMIDSDMTFEPDAIERMAKDMDMGLDYVSGLFFSRQEPIKPMVFSRIDVAKAEDGAIRADVIGYMDYPRDSLFQIQGSGFGGVMMTTDLVRRVWDKYGPPFMPTPVMGEDFAFCYRANQIGGHMFCDSSIRFGHIGSVIYDETKYAHPSGPEISQTHEHAKRG